MLTSLTVKLVDSKLLFMRNSAVDSHDRQGTEKDIADMCLSTFCMPEEETKPMKRYSVKTLQRPLRPGATPHTSPVLLPQIRNPEP